MNLKWINKLSIEQLKRENTRQRKYLTYFLNMDYRWKFSSYIKECFKMINATKQALKNKNIIL